MLATVTPMNTPGGAVLTFVFPLCVLAGVVLWGFFQRKRVR